ncbi:helix-turn-helix domain-containing protein, partial [Enterococcus mundtii]|nr:helix-turn-helix domain-containing protein [Enterococcus mundtii]
MKQGVKQSEIAKGIMDTSAYSRFERGERALTSTELELIMCRLNAHITDLSDIENMENAVAAKIRELTQKSITNEVNLNELKKLYEIAKAEKDQSLRSYRSYLYIKHQFEQTAPFIEPITSEEMDRLFA